MEQIASKANVAGGQLDVRNQAVASRVRELLAEVGAEDREGARACAQTADQGTGPESQRKPHHELPP